MPAAFSTYNSMVGGNELCTCDKVRVGACVGKDPDNGDETFNCAVSADACDDESEFWSRSKLKQEKGNEFECYLCSPFDKAEVPTVEIGAAETISAFSGNNSNSKTTQDCTGGIAVGATVGALMGMFLVFAIQFLCCRRFHGSILDENENSSFNSEFDDSEEFDDCQDFVETTTTNNETKQLEEITPEEGDAEDDEQPGTMA